MAVATQFDSYESESLLWTYEPGVGKLTGKRVFIDGSNTLVGWDEVLRKRPSIRPFASRSQLAGLRAVRLWTYQTIEASPSTFIIGSFLNTSTNLYEVWTGRVLLNVTWTKVTERRDCNHSVYPHCGVEFQGKFYIKSFPNEVAGDRLGSIVLDGTGGTIVAHDWGMLGPTVPAAVSSPGGWNASANSVTVRTGWKYAYTWVNAAGHESSRSPLQTNPDEDPSDTGAFTNLVPELDVIGPSDTTEYPYINIYRTQDGGGTFYFLEQIANTGGTVAYEDDSLESGVGGGTFDDPIPDNVINVLLKAPSETSNAPPPTVRVGGVTGTDTIQQSTQLKVYSNRIWYAIGEFLFYSANEELNAGIGAQAFPEGIVSPNFFAFKEKIVDIITTPDALIVIGQSNTYKIKGTTKLTFNPVDFLPGIGGLTSAYSEKAAVEAGAYSIWITHDLRIIAVQGESFDFISNPLGDTILDAPFGKVTLEYIQERNKEYLVVAVNPTGNADATWLVFDFNLSQRIRAPFWHTPWTMPPGPLVFGYTFSIDVSKKVYCVIYDDSNSEAGKLDFSSYVGDLDPSGGADNTYGAYFTTSLQTIPAGNHVNANTATRLEEVISAFVLTRTKTSGDSDPTVVAYKDNFYTEAINLISDSHPPRRHQATDYKELWHQSGLSKVAKFFAVKVTIPDDAYTAEIHRMAFVWNPGAGA